MKITKQSDGSYSIGREDKKIFFSKDKFEDLYYAVPLSSGHFLRLLQDNICSCSKERHLLNDLLESKDPSEGDILESLQQQIQEMDEPE